VPPPRIAFLDRDGTLIETDIDGNRPVARNSPDKISFFPGVISSCLALREAGYRLVMVTNQPDIARGFVSASQVDQVNRFVARECGIELVLMCEHDDDDNCLCRKPAPGLLLEAARRLGAELDYRSVLVGDRWKDVAAGQAAGVRTVRVGSGYAEIGNRQFVADAVVETFHEAAEWILKCGGGMA